MKNNAIHFTRKIFNLKNTGIFTKYLLYSGFIIDILKGMNK